MFNYDKSSGVVTRLISNSNAVKVGDIVGSVSSSGHLVVYIFGRSYKLHRIIWVYLYGHAPKGQIDHINGDRADNRASNLREVSNLDNCRNQKIRKTNKSGVMGVCWHKRRCKWQSNIMNNDGEFEYLGIFTSMFEAICARKSAEIKYGYHTNHGRKQNG